MICRNLIIPLGLFPDGFLDGYVMPSSDPGVGWFGGLSTSTPEAPLNKINLNWDQSVITRFSNLSWVILGGGNRDGFISWDNIQVNAKSPIPEPATVPLFGIDLLGFAGVSKKKQGRKATEHKQPTELH